ncbi:MAG: hypothetical protein RLZZ630_1853 [Bacteroidota bacterium]
MEMCEYESRFCRSDLVRNLIFRSLTYTLYRSEMTKKLGGRGFPYALDVGKLCAHQ